MVTLPVAPLLEHCRAHEMDQGDLAELAGTTVRAVQRWRHRGVPWSIADRAAIRLGLHPAELWPDWWTLDV